MITESIIKYISFYYLDKNHNTISDTKYRNLQLLALLVYNVYTLFYIVLTIIFEISYFEFYYLISNKNLYKK